MNVRQIAATKVSSQITEARHLSIHCYNPIDSRSYKCCSYKQETDGDTGKGQADRVGDSYFNAAHRHVQHKYT